MNRAEIINELFEKMSTMRRMMFQTHASDASAKNIPTRAQLGILMILGSAESMSIKELAEKFCMTSSAVTQLVDPLVEDGLVERNADTEDRRRIWVSLTGKGRKTLEIARKAHLSSVAKHLEVLSDAELAQLLKIQKKIIDAMRHA